MHPPHAGWRHISKWPLESKLWFKVCPQTKNSFQNRFLVCFLNALFWANLTEFANFTTFMNTNVIFLNIIGFACSKSNTWCSQTTLKMAKNTQKPLKCAKMIKIHKINFDKIIYFLILPCKNMSKNIFRKSCP